MKSPNSRDEREAVRCDCPFDYRLTRTPYLVLPKLALQSMPFEWRDRFEALLVEMEEAGMETPTYEVVPEGGEIRQERCEDEDDWHYGQTVPVASIDDPWANYRYGNIKELCPGFAHPQTKDKPHAL
jgi:hypothetical protein